MVPAFVLTLGTALLVAAASDDGTMEVVATRNGFRPKVLNLRKGETARLLLTTADEEHCFAVDAFRIEKRIVPGRKTLVEVTPERGGTFPFYCCLESDREAMRGRIVVAE